MHKYQEYYEALSYEKRPTSVKQHVYAKGSTEYSTYKYVQKHTDFLLPQVLSDALRHKAKVGVVPELSSMWASLKKFTLWNYANNTISEIEFTSPVTHFMVFRPKPNIFTDKIAECALIVNRSQVIIYGLSTEAKEFISTGLVASVPDRVVSISESQGNVFVGCANGSVYKIIYRNASIFSSQYMYLKDLDSSPFGFMFPAFFKFRRPSAIIRVVSGKHWLLVLAEDEIRIYSIRYERVVKESDMSISVRYVSAEIVEESDAELFFYCVCRDGSRDFYSRDALQFSRKAPFTDNDLSGVGVCTNADTMIIYKKAYSGNMVTVVHFNSDQTVNFSANKAAENFEIINVEDLREVFLEKSSIFCVTGQEAKIYSLMSPEDLLLHCRPEETYSFLKSYGERETLALYYSIMSKNKDYSKLEHLYSKNEAARVSAFYTFVARLVSGILERKIDHDFFMESERVTKRIKNVVNKLKIKDEFVSDLIETVNFLKIYYEYGLVVDETLSKILLESTTAKKTLLDNVINQFGGNMDTIVNLLLARCPSFIPINEVYYQKGLESLEKGDLQGSLDNFKNLSHDLEPIIEKYNALRFYVGSVTLLRKTEQSLERKISLLRESVQCWGALNTALDDFKEEFAFCLFEALLANMQSSSYMKGTCECCGESSDSFTRKNFLSLNSPFLEAFLVEKSEMSFKKEEYTLLWKYYALNNLKEKAVESLLRIAENKPMRLDARIEYLNIAFSIDSSKSLMLRLETAKIQKELLMKKYIPILDNLILSPNDLLNDYIIPNKCFGLGLRLVDLFDYCDLSVLKKLWSDALQQGHMKENLDFIKSLNIKKSALNLEIIATILISKYDSKSPNLINFLVDCGFSKSEVLGLFEKMIKDPRTSHPMQKKKVLDILLQSEEGNTEYAKRVARYCQSNYGIK